MKRLLMSALVMICALTMGPLALAEEAPAKVSALTLQDAEPEKCKRTNFKTGLVKNACKKGLKAAIKAMKAFTKKAKAATGEKVNCKSCHSGLKKDGYPLKSDGLATYKKYKAAIDGAKVRPRLSEQAERALEAWVH